MKQQLIAALIRVNSPAVQPLKLDFGQGDADLGMPYTGHGPSSPVTSPASSPELLSAFTGEIFVRLRGWGLISPRSRVLDLGCGIGRIGVALAPEMMAQARALRPADQSPLWLAAVHGFDLPHNGIACLTLWDGIAFRLRRARNSARWPTRS